MFVICNSNYQSTPITRNKSQRKMLNLLKKESSEKSKTLAPQFDMQNMAPFGIKQSVIPGYVSNRSKEESTLIKKKKEEPDYIYEKVRKLVEGKYTKITVAVHNNITKASSNQRLDSSAIINDENNSSLTEKSIE